MSSVRLKTSVKLSVSLFALTMGLGALTGTAYAQEAATPADEDVTEIVITAQKRSQSLQDTPISVTAVSGKRLADAGVVDISSLDKLAPGLQFGQSGSDARPAMRGARTENVSNQQDPIIAFFVDGVYRSRTSQALAAFVDVERIEVLRGPQGTLYGRNSFGGAINVISKKPTMLQSAGANLTIGNYGALRVDGFFNLPLTDTLALRVSGSSDKHDPYVRNTFKPSEGIQDKDETYLRAQLRWTPNDKLEVIGRASSWTQGGNGSGDFGYFVAGTPVDPNGGAFTFADVVGVNLTKLNPRTGAGLNTPSDASPYSIARDANFDLDTEQTTFDLETNYDFGFANAKLLLSYTDYSSFRTADGDFSVNPSSFQTLEEKVETSTQEVQLNSKPGGLLTWTIGAYRLKDETLYETGFDRIFATIGATNLPDLNTPAPASDFNTKALIDTESYALYGQATYSVLTDLRLTVGLRGSQDKKDFTRFVNSTFTQPLVFSSVPSARDSKTFDKITYRLGAEKDFGPDHLLYASFSTGFQSGGFNSSANAVTGKFNFDEQEVEALEIGLKNSFFNKTLVANVSLFQNNYSGLLANAFINTGPPSNTVVTISTNAGAAEAKGLEIETIWRPMSNLRIDGGFTFNDAKFGDYTISEPVTSLQVNLKGQRIPFTPDFTARISGEYTYALDSGAKLVPAANVYYSDEYSTNDVDYKFARQAAFTKVDLSLTYNEPNGVWSAQLFGRNITNEETITRTVRFGQNVIGQSFAPRGVYGVRLSYGF
jgi:iron complex outermembrane recepter protein